MKNSDGRSLDHSTLEYIRLQAVKAVRKGMSPREVGEIFGMHRSKVYEWVKKAKEMGLATLNAKPVPGRKSFINEQQEGILVFWLCAFTPLDFEFSTVLWTTEMIKTLIERKFSIYMSRSAVGRFLRRINLTPQRPVYRAIERDQFSVDNWINKEFPRIKELASNEGAIIYFLDEAGARTDYHAGTTWGLEGLTPIIPSTGGRYRINMIAAITSEGKMHFQIGPSSLNGGAFVEYLKILAQENSCPIYIVTDGYSAHHAKVVKEYLETTNGKVKIFFLPTYSPHLNPVELVWSNIKTQGIARHLIRNVEELKNKATQLLEDLKKSPEKVRELFKEESVQYAI
ncbi:transposase [Gammaproteobacteria bacterium]